MRYPINLCRLATTTILSIISVGFLATPSIKAYTLNWTRSTLAPTEPEYIEWDTSVPDLTNIYEFDPDYTAEVGSLYVKLTVLTEPTGHEINTQLFGTTPGIYSGNLAQAGAGGFIDELFVFTNDNADPDTITLTIEFFSDASGTQATNVTDFNTTITDLDAGNNGQRQESIIITGEDTSTAQITPTFTVPTGSLVTVPPNTFSDNEVIGHTTGITDEKGNVRVFFPGDIHKVSIDFIATTQGSRNRNMFITDLAITPDLAPLQEIPFNFSPTTGIILSIGIFSSNYIRKKYF